MREYRHAEELDPRVDAESSSAYALRMCNDYEQHIRWAEYCDMMQALDLGIPTQQSELDLPQADDVRINDMAPVMRAGGNLVELVQ